MTARRTPRQQVAAFKRANDKSLVVSGYALHVGGHTPECCAGAVYRLADGTRHRLGSEAHTLLEDPYPRWKVA